jgi:hypothetical protein
VRNRMTMRPRLSVGRRVGLGVFLFALVAQPLIGPLLIGRPWTQAEIFGIAPDPTAVATLGLIAAADRPLWHLYAVPLLWCAISGATLWTMGSPDALVLPAAALLAIALVAWKTLSRTAHA